MYDSIEIENFRGLRHLRLEGLRRVNLIVGDNDVGKTSLLEALTLLGRPGDRAIIEALTVARGLATAPRTPQLLWHYLYTDENTAQDIAVRGQLGDGSTESVALSTSHLTSITNEGSTKSSSAQTADGGLALGAFRLATSGGDPFSGRLACIWSADAMPVASLTITIINGNSSTEMGTNRSTAEGIARQLSSRGASSLEELATYFSVVSDMGREGDLLKAIQAVDPRVTDISLAFTEGRPMLRVRLGERARFPLALLGDGAQRVVEMVLAILAVKGGSVLIDDADSGIYFRRLEAMWRAIDTASALAGVQLFVTTHGWECITAAVSAFSDERSQDFRMYRLERDADGNIRPVVYEHDTALAAIDLGIEVR